MRGCMTSSRGGGRALGEACHFIDSLIALVGARVTDVYASGHGKPSLPVQARDNLSITLTFVDGSVGTVVYVAQGSRQLPKERIECFSGARTAILDDFKSLELHDASSSERVIAPKQDKGHTREVAAFVEGVRTGVPPIPLDEIANGSLATLAIVESLRSGRPVRLG